LSNKGHKHLKSNHKFETVKEVEEVLYVDKDYLSSTLENILNYE